MAVARAYRDRGAPRAQVYCCQVVTHLVVSIAGVARRRVESGPSIAVRAPAAHAAVVEYRAGVGVARGHSDGRAPFAQVYGGEPVPHAG